MATTVDELIVEIRASTKDLQQGLRDVRKRVDNLDKGVKNSIISFQSLGRVFAAIGLARLAGGIVNTSRTFEDLNATLRAITGSSEAAAASMDLIRSFTATTTFQLENVTSAFTTLLNAGITPTSDVLQDFGNVAAAFNKDITTMAQAAFNATTGEMEMLKQFGIIAKVEGDKLAVTFDNTTTTINRDSQSIIDFIRKIGQEKFPTALEERADTVSGAFSNLADATSELFNAVGESGLNEALVNLARGLIDLVNGMRPLARVLGAGINALFAKLASMMEFARQNAQALKGALAVVVSTAVLVNIRQLTAGFIQLGAGILDATRALGRFMRRNPVLVFATLAATIAYATGVLDDFTDEFEAIGNAVDQALGKIPGLTALFESLDDILGEGALTTSLEDANARMEELLGASTAAGAGLAAMKDNAKAVEEEIQNLSESIASSTQQMTNSFVTALMDGQNALSAFKDFAKQIVAQIISTFINLFVVNKILNAIFGSIPGFTQLPTMGFPSFGSGGSAAVGGAGQPYSATAYPGTLPQPLTRTPLRATGGSVTSGTSYLVGERGPELFTPHTAGTISRNAQNGGSPVIVQQTINLSAGVAGTVRAEVERMLPRIAEVSKAGVLEATRRGGTYRKALLGS